MKTKIYLALREISPAIFALNPQLPTLSRARSGRGDSGLKAAACDDTQGDGIVPGLAGKCRCPRHGKIRPQAGHQLGGGINPMNEFIVAAVGRPPQLSEKSKTPALCRGAATPFCSGISLLLAAAVFLTACPARADWALYASSYGNNKIVKFNTNGVATVFATNGVNGVLSQPDGLVFDDLGNLYVANDGNNTIEKYDTQGNGTVFASSGINDPGGLAFDGLERLLVANFLGSSLFKITNSSGQGSVFASGGPAVFNPLGTAFDIAGNLYLGNNGNDF